MDTHSLLVALGTHFAALVAAAPPPRGLLRFEDGSQAWALALCPEQPTAADYLLAFERSMQALVEAAAAGDGERLGLALDLASTERGVPASYRRALKKYSNSIVFEDLGISLLLARADGSLLALAPGEAKAFLRDLNRWIAAQRKI